MTEPEAIHQYAGLDYWQYLSLPRSVLQSMPDEWQTKFVALLKEMDNTIDWRPPAGHSYNVQLCKLVETPCQFPTNENGEPDYSDGCTVEEHYEFHDANPDRFDEPPRQYEVEVLQPVDDQFQDYQRGRRRVGHNASSMEIIG